MITFAEMGVAGAFITSIEVLLYKLSFCTCKIYSAVYKSLGCIGAAAEASMRVYSGALLHREKRDDCMTYSYLGVIAALGERHAFVATC